MKIFFFVMHGEGGKGRGGEGVEVGREGGWGLGWVMDDG